MFEFLLFKVHCREKAVAVNKGCVQIDFPFGPLYDPAEYATTNVHIVA